MTTTPKLNRVSPWQRLLESIQKFFQQGDFTALVLMTILLLMPAFSLSTAGWPLEMQTALPVLVIAIAFGVILAKSHYNELLALIVSGTYCVLIILLVAAFGVSGNLVEGTLIVITRFIQWLFDFVTGGINQDPLAFTLLVATLFWFLAYNAAWHIFRIDRVFLVLIPPAMILLINMIIYTGENSLDLYLIIFMLIALLLIVRSNLAARQYDWAFFNIRVPGRFQRRFLQVGLVLSLAASVVAWSIPASNIQERLDGFQEFLNSDPLRQVAEFFNRLIEPIESEGPATADYYGGDSLNLGGAIRLGDQVIMLVNVPNDRRYYWRSRVFERYDGGQWSPSATLRVPDTLPPLEIIVNDEVMGGQRVQVTQTFTIGTGGSRLVYAAPQPIQVNLAVRTDLTRLNPDLEEASPVNVSVIRPTKVLERGVTYDATSLMSIANAFELRSAPMTYPEWVSNPNAFPGVGVSGRVVNLAREIVTNANAETPYDRAKAIETWLRNNITYNERIPAPPVGVDPMEWFLFEMRQGYCTYYATSMIVMLRSLGIPARMAAGFAQGEWDASLNQYVVRERDAHTWVEVYFPGYSWIEFEPTSAQQPINREGDNQIQPAPQAAAPQPTATPSSTPTPIPSATSAQSPTPSQNQQDPLQPPTATPTPSPTPTATPVIVPTVQPPVKPPEPPTNDFLAFLLPAIGAALLLFFTIVLLILLAVFVYWWWEWRGMGGLSPVSRAYARLNRYLPLLKIYTAPQETPEERREKIISRLPGSERPVTAITRTYTEERYAKPTEGTAEGGRNARIADNAWLAARTQIVRRWLRRRFMPWRKD